VCVAFGDESFLKRHVLLRLRQAVLGEGDAEISFSTFEGEDAKLSDVLGELSTMALFGGGKRVALVAEADDFVSRFRAELEQYVAKPKSSGVLLLEVKSFPGNTRLAKAVAESGLAIECTSPSANRLGKWLSGWARTVHGVQLPAAAAEVLAELAGPELGLIDQELAKLALTVGADKKLTEEAVRQTVGGWRARTAWDMLDAALDGDVRQALTQLDRLLLSGENPIAILAQVSATLRRMAAATRLVLAGEAARRRVSPRDALAQAGVKGFVLEKTERQLKRLGRQRGEHLYQWLLDADLDLKGASHLPPRTVLERLFVRLSVPASPARTR
jgi:DNA polymerase-3 subunit delta